jgi:hypothetical protein
MQAEGQRQVGASPPLILDISGDQLVYVAQRCAVDKLLRVGSGIEAGLKVGIARGWTDPGRDFLSEQRPGYQVEKHNRTARRATEGSALEEVVRPEEAVGGEHAQPGRKQRDLRAGPNRLELAAKFEGVIPARVRHVLSSLEVLFLVEVHAADKAAAIEQVGNVKRGLESGTNRIQVKYSPAILHQGVGGQVIREHMDQVRAQRLIANRIVPVGGREAFPWRCATDVVLA